MSPPCQNCHSAGPTIPAADGFDDFYGRKENYPAFSDTSVDPEQENHASDCSAANHWPEWLAQAQPELQTLPFWVRNNFENTLRENRLAMGDDLEEVLAHILQGNNPGIALPFRIEIEEGSLDIKLIPKSGSLGKIHPSLADVHLEAGLQAAITSRVEIRNNHIPLMLQNLVEFHDVKVGYSSWLLGEVSPEKISVGNHGGLHFIFRGGNLVQGVLNLLSGVMSPAPALGYDYPYLNPDIPEECYFMPNFHAHCPPDSPLEYPNNHNSRRHIVLTDKIPHEFRDSQSSPLMPYRGKLPLALHVEELILRALKFKKNHPSDPNKKSQMDLQGILDSFHSGEVLTLEIAKLKDFFKAGVVDLGPSSGIFTARLSKENEILVDAGDFELNLEPMDYFATEGKRGAVRLEGGRLTPGSYEGVENNLPGIHVVYDPGSGQVSLTANLQANLDLVLPVLGPVHFSGQILMDTAMVQTEKGIKILPKATTLEIQNLSLYSEEGDWSHQAKVFISDNPDKKRDRFVLYETHATPPRFQVDIQGFPIQLFGNLDIPTLEDGSYDFKNIKNSLNFETRLSHHSKRWGDLETRLKVKSFIVQPQVPMAYLSPEDKIEATYRIDLSAQQTLPHHQQSHPVLTEAQVWFHPRQENGHHYYDVNIDAKSFGLKFPAPIMGQSEIKMNGIRGTIQIDRASLGEKVSDIRFPMIKLEFNHEGSSRGILRGRAKLFQTPGKNFEAIWDGPNRRLTIKELDLTLDIQRAYVIPKKVLRILDPRVASAGLDGHIQGDFNFSFQGKPHQWHGDGLVLLKGDSQGDIYLLDGRGRMVDTVFRKTRWKIKEIKRINTTRGYAMSDMGDMDLRTWFNLGIINYLAGGRGPRTPDLVERLTGQKPLEVEWNMNYDNQPYLPEGFTNRNVDYTRTICRETPWCMDPTHPDHPDYKPEGPAEESPPPVPQEGGTP